MHAILVLVLVAVRAPGPTWPSDITLLSAEAAPGAVVEFSGQGPATPDGGSCAVYLDQQPVLARCTITSSGAIGGDFSVPDGARVGPNEVAVCAPDCYDYIDPSQPLYWQARSSVQVIPAELPPTTGTAVTSPAPPSGSATNPASPSVARTGAPTTVRSDASAASDSRIATTDVPTSPGRRPDVDPAVVGGVAAVGLVGVLGVVALRRNVRRHRPTRDRARVAVALRPLGQPATRLDSPDAGLRHVVRIDGRDDPGLQTFEDTATAEQ